MEAAALLKKKSISDLEVKGKRVLMRVDFNVPQDKKDPSVITNTARYAPRLCHLARRHEREYGGLQTPHAAAHTRRLSTKGQGD